MKYRYRNRKTGEIITTSNKVSGTNWEPVEETRQPPMEDIPEGDDFEEVYEEAPVEKPKASRRGKK